MRHIHRLLVLNLLSNLAGRFFVVSGQGSCSDVAELWCQINPTYTTLDINPGHSETITCTIPSTPGAWSTVNFFNQLGHVVTDLPNVNLYRIDSSSSDTEKAYHVNISWTFDRDIREQLKVIQCKANFQCRTRPYNSSIVSINFVDTKQEPTTAVTTLSPTTQTTSLPTTQTTQTIKTTQPPTTQTTLQPTTQTATKTSDCLCTPSQCATLVPEVDRSRNSNELLMDLTQNNNLSQGFKLPCIINSFKLLFSVFFILLFSVC